MVRFGFGSLGLHRIEAGVFSRNPPSGRVLEKAGFMAEGLLRGCCRKGEAFEDVIMYAILRDDAELVDDLH